MTRHARRLTLAVVPLVLLALPSFAARADSCVAPAGTIYSRPLSPDGSVRTIAGDVTPFGPITGGLILNIDHTTGTFTGEFAFKAKGGVAYGTINGQFLSGNTYYETLTFTGGTGKYARISGSAGVYGTLDLMDGTGVDVVLGGLICVR